MRDVAMAIAEGGEDGERGLGVREWCSGGFGLGVFLSCSFYREGEGRGGGGGGEW